MGQIIRNGITYGGGSGGGLNVSKAILLESIVPSTNQTLQYSQPIENFDYISITIHDSVGNSTCEYIPKENYGSVFSIQTWTANNGYISFCPKTGEISATNNSTIDTIIGHKFSVSGGTSPSTPLINYSTKEQVIGTWIDGKPIYARTFIISDFKFSQSKDLTDDLFTEIEFILGAEMYDTTSSTARFVPVGAKKSSSNTITFYYSGTWDSIDAYTIRYTKTTD